MAHLEDAGRRSTERIAHRLVKISPEKLRLGMLRLEPWLPAILVLAILVLWEVLSRLGKISLLFFPPPSLILSTLWQMIVSGKLWPHMLATFERLALGFSMGGFAGLILGLGMGWSSRLRAVADPIIAALHPIPKIAIFPLIMIIFGIGEASKVVAIAIAAFFPMLINSMAGVRQLSPVYFEVTQNYGANRRKTFSRVIIPGSLPLILTGIRLAINMAMVIAIAVELLAAKEGLGVIIWFSWQTLRIEDLYASLIVIAVLGISINLLLQHITHKLAPWYNDQSERQL
jgi:ABC-type nitrate/sulfonate/bicarbonate transport system permease component